MDFIEGVFGVSPDGGSGALELTLFLIPFLILVLRMWWTQAARKKDPGNG